MAKVGNNANYDSISLSDWIKNHHSDEELRDLFLNMDIALKYIHDHNYCVEVFYPTEIEVLDNKPDHIQFNRLLELSSNPSIKNSMIKEDIFNSSLIQVGIYTNTLKRLTPDFLRENFEQIAQFLPEGDVPYYRGVVQRGASVYFCEYALEKRNRDLANLEKELGEGDGNSKQFTKTNGLNAGFGSISNDRINDSIYKQINGYKDSAFINYLLIPTLALLGLALVGAVGWFLSLF